MVCESSLNKAVNSKQNKNQQQLPKQPMFNENRNKNKTLQNIQEYPEIKI